MQIVSHVLSALDSDFYSSLYDFWHFTYFQVIAVTEGYAQQGLEVPLQTESQNQGE